jgi:hypothetical protein
MMDLFIILVTILFFLITYGLIVMCSHLMEK